ncbi:MAG: hypothetical protein IKK09_13100 [Clostridia bacterium]|nr:hypothetical protein [Clostridia bacterium]
MKKILKRLGFHKMDEMEQSIMFKAQRNAFLFLEFALIIWAFYESYKVLAYHTHLNILPSMLAMVGLAIQNVSQLIMTHNAVKGDEESPNASPLFKTVLLCIVVAAITLIILNIIIMFWVMK